ncbi:MAG: hypothetical protein V4510_13335 [bacterium]
MKTYLLAAILAGILASSGAAVVVVKIAPTLGGTNTHDHAGANMAAMHGGMAGDDPHAQLGMERLTFHQAVGNVPTADQAQKLEQLSYVEITNDTEFNPSHAIRSGSGTLDDPYVISGYDVTGDLWISDTDACFEILDNWIDGQLHLNWNGQCVFVHHNYIRDLRVNENDKRTGLDTGGLIELNKISYVGQIRHFDGEFRNNVVGPREDQSLPNGVFRDPENLLPFAKDTRVLNIDGWNEALFDHNTITGSTDLKLHGHHHSTGFLATHSHYHGDAASRESHMEDHTMRWESVSFTDNLINDPTGYGLRYSDENHAGDDRTANSESNKMLEKPHQHFTAVTIARNTLEGAGILVDIFNADDELHYTTNPGWMDIQDNKIHIKERDPDVLGTFVFFGPRYAPNTGIRVWEAKEVKMRITGNTVAFDKSSTPDPLAPLNPITGNWFGRDSTPMGVQLDGVNNATVTVANNKATGFDYGVAADQMNEATHWAVYGNTVTGATHDVYYDDTVANKPQSQPFPAEPSPQEQAPPPPMDM